MTLSESKIEALAALEGMVSRVEGVLLAGLASAVPEGQVIVEIGSYKGKSACFLAAGSKAGARVPVFAVDMWDVEAHAAGSPFAAAGIRETFDSQVAAMQMKTIIRPMQGLSVEVAESFPHSIGLLFIDAGHSYGSAMADYQAWEPKVASGGVVVFHDYENPRWTQGVKRVVHETIRQWPGFSTAGWLAWAVKP